MPQRPRAGRNAPSFCKSGSFLSGVSGEPAAARKDRTTTALARQSRRQKSALPSVPVRRNPLRAFGRARRRGSRRRLRRWAANEPFRSGPRGRRRSRGGKRSEPCFHDLEVRVERVGEGIAITEVRRETESVRDVSFSLGAGHLGHRKPLGDPVIALSRLQITEVLGGVAQIIIAEVVHIADLHDEQRQLLPTAGGVQVMPLSGGWLPMRRRNRADNRASAGLPGTDASVGPAARSRFSWCRRSPLSLPIRRCTRAEANMALSPPCGNYGPCQRPRRPCRASASRSR